MHIAAHAAGLGRGGGRVAHRLFQPGRPRCAMTVSDTRPWLGPFSPLPILQPELSVSHSAASSPNLISPYKGAVSPQSPTGAPASHATGTAAAGYPPAAANRAVGSATAGGYSSPPQVRLGPCSRPGVGSARGPLALHAGILCPGPGLCNIRIHVALMASHGTVMCSLAAR